MIIEIVELRNKSRLLEFEVGKFVVTVIYAFFRKNEIWHIFGGWFEYLNVIDFWILSLDL
ncbi:hypothetical protein LguiA_026867 [Lonicera macranthoides]